MTKRVKKKTDRLQRMMRLVPRPAPAFAVLAIFTFLALTGLALTDRDKMAAPAIPDVIENANTSSYSPSELSAEDRGLYAMIERAQEKKDYSEADQLMNHLKNRYLVGYMLAERYLAPGYQVRDEELNAWLTNYADHPQAARISAIAKRRGIEFTLAKAPAPLKGEGYSDHQGRTGMPDSWYTALNFWREKEYGKAGELFTKLSENEDLSDWQRSAAYYWAYRAADKEGEDHAAHAALKHAAEYRTTFYGLLAGKQLGMANLAAEAPEVSDKLRNDPRAIRAALLVALGRDDDAEVELRALYGSVSGSERGGIVTLASELGMPNLQMRLSRTTGLSDSEALFAHYPAPQYMVDLHAVMDPALLMAVARNESGFRELARNGSSGALGMMQMLPSTARTVEKRVGQDILLQASAGDSNAPLAERLNNPALSARYGAEYLKMLTKEPAIGQSLVHLLIGYNAGPGTAASWKSAGRNIQDPLLYIESIPFAETRNYVMQVSAQYWIYQMMLDQKPASLGALAKGEWPELAAAK